MAPSHHLLVHFAYTLGIPNSLLACPRSLVCHLTWLWEALLLSRVAHKQLHGKASKEVAHDKLQVAGLDAPGS